MVLKVIKEEKDFDEIISSKDQCVFVDFTATWCGPCKMIGPVFEELSTKYSNVIFVKVDVDESSDIAQKRGISAMPTFHAYKDGEKIDEFVGADEKKLKDFIEKNK